MWISSYKCPDASKKLIIVLSCIFFVKDLLLSYRTFTAECGSIMTKKAQKLINKNSYSFFNFKIRYSRKKHFHALNNYHLFLLKLLLTLHWGAEWKACLFLQSFLPCNLMQLGEISNIHFFSSFQFITFQFSVNMIWVIGLFDQ